jgi:hypothetical protein
VVLRYTYSKEQAFRWQRGVAIRRDLVATFFCVQGKANPNEIMPLAAE